MAQDKEPTNEIESEETAPESFSYAKLGFAIIVAVLVAVIFFLVSIYYGFIIILSVDAAQALVEAIATVLGFFGLIAVYLLTSFDSRIDRLEEKIQDSNDDAKTKHFTTIQMKIKTRKGYATIRIITGLSCLLVSLLLSITNLGILSVTSASLTETGYQLAFLITIVTSMFLFSGVVDILIMVYSVGNEQH